MLSFHELLSAVGFFAGGSQPVPFQPFHIDEPRQELHPAADVEAGVDLPAKTAPLIPYSQLKQLF